MAQHFLEAKECVAVPMALLKEALDAGKLVRVEVLTIRNTVLQVWSWTEKNSTIYMLEKITNA